MPIFIVKLYPFPTLNLKNYKVDIKELNCATKAQAVLKAKQKFNLKIKTIEVWKKHL